MTITQRAPAHAPLTAAVPVIAARKKRRSILVWLSYVWLVLIIALSVFAAVLPIPPFELPIGLPRQPPQFTSIDLLLGTDSLGRSMLSRIVYGAQVSLVVGAIAGLTGFLIGSTLGLLSGHFRGRVDWVISLFADALLAFPPLILLLALASVLTPSLATILIGLTLVTVPTFTRLARANTISWASREFVRAAKNMGASDARIVFKEILPNVLPAISAYLPIVVAALIVAEGSLSFLGLGLPPPTPSWGNMIYSGKDSIATSPHLVLVPAMVIFFTVFALNQAGDHLRLRFDRTMR